MFLCDYRFLNRFLNEDNLAVLLVSSCEARANRRWTRGSDSSHVSRRCTHSHKSMGSLGDGVARGLGSWETVQVSSRAHAAYAVKRRSTATATYHLSMYTSRANNLSFSLSCAPHTLTSHQLFRERRVMRPRRFWTSAHTSNPFFSLFLLYYRISPAANCDLNATRVRGFLI